MTDLGLSSFLSRNKSAGVLANVSNLKNDLYDQGASAADFQEEQKDVSWTDQINSLKGIASTATTSSQAVSGVFTGISTLFNTRKIIKLAQDKKAAAAEKSKSGEGDEDVEGESDIKGTVADIEKTGEETTDSLESGLNSVATTGEDLVNNLISGATNAVSNLTSQASSVVSNLAGQAKSAISGQGSGGVVETDLAPTDVSTEFGTIQSTEPSGYGGGDIELTDTNVPDATNPFDTSGNTPDWISDAATQAGTDAEAAGDAAQAAEAVTEAGASAIEVGTELASTALDFIPVIGEIASVVVGIGGSVLSGVEDAAAESTAQTESAADLKQQQADKLQSAQIEGQSFLGGNISDTLSSLTEMPSNQGSF